MCDLGGGFWQYAPAGAPPHHPACWGRTEASLLGQEKLLIEECMNMDIQQLRERLPVTQRESNRLTVLWSSPSSEHPQLV